MKKENRDVRAGNCKQRQVIWKVVALKVYIKKASFR